jgi:hypothetical protein
VVVTVQYSFLVVTELVSGYYCTCFCLFLVVRLLSSGCYGTCFCMLWYLFLVVAVEDFAFMVVLVFFLVVMVPVSG